ncbi:hypothetical protein CK203_014235 [Vitis vinifera]|uniref:Uncharacterized protein n=1 Tax=Vitis vinifera TaxID=29760 RepID=A0A438JHV3_VITVI|nr:hypothetical protein CK203_014235 [Vitis vinifera]
MDRLSISFISLINCFESSFLPLEGKKNEGIKHSIHGDPSAIMCLIGGDGNTGRYWQTPPGANPTRPVKPQRVTCYNHGSKCFLKYVTCPAQCPQVQPKDGKSKGCFLDCYSPKCEAVCRGRKPNCNGVGAACFDPRFIGGDGIVFYFHGKGK